MIQDLQGRINKPAKEFGTKGFESLRRAAETWRMAASGTLTGPSLSALGHGRAEDKAAVEKAADKKASGPKRKPWGVDLEGNPVGRKLLLVLGDDRADGIVRIANVSYPFELGNYVNYRAGIAGVILAAE